MLFFSGRGAAGAGPSGWTRIAPWMRTTGDTGKVSRRKSEGVSGPPHPNSHLSTEGSGISGAVSSLVLTCRLLDQGLQEDSSAGGPSSRWHRNCG